MMEPEVIEAPKTDFYEVAYEVGGVELIDPATIRSPSNKWG